MPSVRAISICRVLSRQIVFAFLHASSSCCRRLDIATALPESVRLSDACRTG
jgi:hypothetical protein